MKIITKHCIFSGIVQGVGFRLRCKQKAEELHLAGFVKNLPDGSVEALFQGPLKDVDKCILYCKDRITRVTNMTCITVPKENNTDFQVHF